MVKTKTLVSIGIVIVFIILGFSLFYGSSEESHTDGDGHHEPEITLTGETKVFEITAKNWEFSPSLIEVNLGDKVELHLNSIEGVHGFTIPEFGISESLEPENDIHVEFIADKKGSFSFYCYIPCGRGHGGMGGTLVVK